MNIIIVTATIFFITTIGYSIIQVFHLLPEKDVLSTIAYGYGLGAGLIALQLYTYSRLGIGWNKEGIIFPWTCLVLVSMYLKRKRDSYFYDYLVRSKKNLFELFKMNRISIFLLTAIIVTCIYVIFEALIRPVMAWDAWAIWLLKSKIFFMDGKISPGVLSYIKSDYPLIISLLGTFIYIMLGHIDDTTVLLISSSFYIVLSLLFFAVLRKRFGTMYAVLFTFLLMTTQNFIRHAGRIEAGQADLPLGFYIFASINLLLEYLKKSNTKMLFLLSIFLGITALIKVEGYPFSFLAGMLILIHIYKKRLTHHIMYLSLWLIPIIDWELYKRTLDIKVNYFSAHPFEWSIQKTIQVFSRTTNELLRITSWSLLWIVYFYSLICHSRGGATAQQKYKKKKLQKKKKNWEIALLNLFIIFQFSLYICMYLFTAGNGPESSIERLLMHIAPLVFYYIAIICHSVFLKNQKTLFTKYFPQKWKK